MWTFLFTRAGKAILAAIGGTLLLIAIFLFGYNSAEKDNKVDELKNRAKTLERAKEVEDELENLDPDERLRRLDGWLRDAD